MANYLKQEMELFTEWKDAEDIAGATGRIAPRTTRSPIAGTVTQGQQVLKAPTCAQPHLDAFKNPMDETIAAYLAFMATKSDEEVNRHFTSATVQNMVMTKLVMGSRNGGIAYAEGDGCSRYTCSQV